MALSGLKRTVANPDAARRKGEQDFASPQSQTNGDSAPAVPSAVAEDTSEPTQHDQESPDGQEPAPAPAAEWEQEQELQAQEARRQSQEGARARRQEIRRSQHLLAANMELEAKRKEKQQVGGRTDRPVLRLCSCAISRLRLGCFDALMFPGDVHFSASCRYL